MHFMGDQLVSKESHLDIDMIAKSPCTLVSAYETLILNPVDPVFAAWRKLVSQNLVLHLRQLLHIANSWKEKKRKGYAFQRS